MLLFFPLFVVVVAVDARWVTRSLETEFPYLLESQERRAPAIGIAENERTEVAGRRRSASTVIGVSPATALDYIEKIFHIPFWVRSMDKRNSADFVEGLAGGFTGSDSQLLPSTSTGPNATAPTTAETPNPEIGKHQRPTDSNVAPTTDDQPTRRPVPLQRKDPASQRTKVFKTTPLSPDEIAMLRRFAPFIGDTPRRAKRFVNRYHLLRTSLGRTGDIRGADDSLHWLV